MVPSQLNNRRDGPEAVLEPRLENRGGMIDMKLSLWGQVRVDLGSNFFKKVCSGCLAGC